MILAEGRTDSQVGGEVAGGKEAISRNEFMHKYFKNLLMTWGELARGLRAVTEACGAKGTWERGAG